MLFKKEISNFFGVFLIYLTFFISCIFAYEYFFIFNDYEFYALNFAFSKSLLFVFDNFLSFYIFLIIIYFSFYFNSKDLEDFRNKKSAYIFENFSFFFVIFFVSGVIYVLVFLFFYEPFNLSYEKLSLKYEKFIHLEAEANKNIENINNSSNIIASKDTSLEDLYYELYSRTKAINNLIEIFESILLIYPSYEKASYNIYVYKDLLTSSPSFIKSDIQDISKEIKSLKIQNFLASDFIFLINRYIKEEKFPTANYLAYLGTRATNNEEIKLLYDKTQSLLGSLIQENLNKKLDYNSKKRQVFFYLENNRILDAYYAILDLEKEKGNFDSEIGNQKKAILQELRKNYLLYNEIKHFFENYDYSNLFFLEEKDNFFDYIYINKAVNYNNSFYLIKGLEVLRFDKNGNFITHLYIPYASFLDGVFYNNIIGKEERNLKELQILYLKGSNYFNAKEEIVITKTKIDKDTFPIFSNKSSNIYLPLERLFNLFSNFKPRSVDSNFIFIRTLLLILSPFLFILIGIYSLSFFSRGDFFTYKNILLKFGLFLLCIFFSLFLGEAINFIALNLGMFFLLIFSSLYLTSLGLIIAILLISFLFLLFGFN